MSIARSIPTLVRSSKPAKPVFDGPNRRRSKREPNPVIATIQPASGSTDVEESVDAQDLSLGGVGLICDRKFRIGSVWRITLQNGPLFLNAKIRVVSCRSRSDHRYDVGCTFC